jgi:CRP/FNR family transcriptional regulator, cyclic AMP receptor protein
MKGYVTDYLTDQVLCREKDPSAELYYLMSGKLLVCTIVGTEVKAIARIDSGQFIGELSFFDGNPRSSHVVALENCKIATFSKNEITPQLPLWYVEINKNLTKKIRLLDKIIHENSLRRFGLEDQIPLTIEEQRKLYRIITQQ